MVNASRLWHNEKPNARSTVFDLMKLLGMCFICLGHVLQRFYTVSFPNEIGFSIIYSASLALFFFTGGFFVKRTHGLSELLLYLLKLAITYIGVGFLFTCFNIWWLPRFSDHDFGWWMRELYLRTDTFYWYFLTAAFINAAIALFYFLSNSVIKRDSLRNEVFRYVFVGILLFIYSMIFLWIYNQPDLGPGCLSSNELLYFLPISFVGFGFRSFLPFIKNQRLVRKIQFGIFSISLCCYITSLLFYPNWISGLSSDFWTITWHMFGALAGCLMYFQFFCILEKWKPLRALSRFGQISGPFYLVHVFIVRLFASYISRPTVLDGNALTFVVFLCLVFFFGSLCLTQILVTFPYTDFFLFANAKRFDDCFPFIRKKE